MQQGHVFCTVIVCLSHLPAAFWKLNGAPWTQWPGACLCSLKLSNPRTGQCQQPFWTSHSCLPEPSSFRRLSPAASSSCCSCS